jgi:hypothetical protein
MAEHVGHERLKAAGRPVPGGDLALAGVLQAPPVMKGDGR